MMAVIARSMSSGFFPGAVTTIGIVLGDFVFIFLVFFSINAMSKMLGELFQVVSYLGGAYLCYLGLSVLRSPFSQQTIAPLSEVSLWRNFLAGLLITLSNPKAILFYAGFLPAFIDVAQANLGDLLLVLLAATLAVGSSMFAYAYVAAKAGTAFKGTLLEKRVSSFAGLLLLGTGIYLFTRA